MNNQFNDQSDIDGCGILCKRNAWHCHVFDLIPDEKRAPMIKEILSSVCDTKGEWIVISVMAPQGVPHTALMYAPASEKPPFSIIVNGERVYKNLRSVAAAQIWSQVVGGRSTWDANDIVESCKNYFRARVVNPILIEHFRKQKLPKSNQEKIAEWLEKHSNKLGLAIRIAGEAVRVATGKMAHSFRATAQRGGLAVVAVLIVAVIIAAQTL